MLDIVKAAGNLVQQAAGDLAQNNDAKAIGTIGAAASAAGSLGSVTVATVTTSAPGILGAIGLTTTSVVALPVDISKIVTFCGRRRLKRFFDTET